MCSNLRSKCSKTKQKSNRKTIALFIFIIHLSFQGVFPCLQRRIEVCMRRFGDPWRFCCVAKPWSILMNFFDGQDSKCVTDCLVFLKIGFFPTSFNPSSCTKVIIPHIISVLGTNSALWLLNYANSHLYMASHCWPLSS